MAITVTAISTLLPEAARHWFYWPQTAVLVVSFVAPMIYTASTLATYYLSGKKKLSLLLWLLAPLCFFNALQAFVVFLLWTLHGGRA